MTVSKAMERADNLRPNPFEEEQKVRWLSELDGKIAREILKRKDFIGYDYSKDIQKELIAEEEYCDIYLFYLTAMIDFFSRDYVEYNNSMLMFNEAFERYAKAYKRGDMNNNIIFSKNGEYYKNIF